MRRRGVLGGLILLLGLVGGGPASGGTPVKPYLVPVGTSYYVKPLLSVGETVPHASAPGSQYQMVGIPDGLAVHRSRRGAITVFLNHEFRFDAQVQTSIPGPLDRGAVVSKFRLNAAGDVLTGARAYDSAFNENAFVGPAATVENTTPAFGRFCSSSYPGKDVGFDRRIYLANEETDAPNAFDARGASTVAIFNRGAYALPRLGHFAKENSLVMKGTGASTVILSLEDGPSTPDSQLYMYVGSKQPQATSPLTRNGLDNGELYVLAASESGIATEGDFTTGSLQGRWALIPNAGDLTDVQLEEVADAAGALGFVRMEDGAFNKTIDNVFYFVTTGGNESAGNKLGRLYQLTLDASNVTGPATLTVVYNAAAVIGGGGDTAISPDNLDTSDRYLMIQEGGTGPARTQLRAARRDLSIWRFGLAADGTVGAASPQRIAVLYPPGRDGTTVDVGVWEPSGIVDASAAFGPDSWLLTVQAHPPTTAPGVSTVQDGQLLLLRPTA